MAENAAPLPPGAVGRLNVRFGLACISLAIAITGCGPTATVLTTPTPAPTGLAGSSEQPVPTTGPGSTIDIDATPGPLSSSTPFIGETWQPLADFPVGDAYEVTSVAPLGAGGFVAVGFGPMPGEGFFGRRRGMRLDFARRPHLELESGSRIRLRDPRACSRGRRRDLDIRHDRDVRPVARRRVRRTARLGLGSMELNRSHNVEPRAPSRILAHRDHRWHHRNPGLDCGIWLEGRRGHVRGVDVR